MRTTIRTLRILTWTLILLCLLSACDIFIGTFEVGIESEPVTSVSPPSETPSIATVEPTEPIVPTVPPGSEPTTEPDTEVTGASLSGLIYNLDNWLYQINEAGVPVPFFDRTSGITISPDGRYVLYGEPRQPDIWIADLLTGSREKLTDTPERQNLNPQWWEHTHRVILLSRSRTYEGGPIEDGLGYLTVINQDGSDYRVLEEEATSFVQPVPSPIDEVLAYARADSEGITTDNVLTTPWLYHFEYSTSLPFDFRDYGFQPDYEVSFGAPAWSPNGRYLAWVIGGNLSSTGAFQVGLVIFDLIDKTAAMALAHESATGPFAYSPPAPRWSSDSQYLTWEGGPVDALPGFWIVNAKGEEVLYQSEGFQPRWNPDGPQLVFIQSDQSGQLPTNQIMEIGEWSPQELALPEGSLVYDWITGTPEIASQPAVPELIWIGPPLSGAEAGAKILVVRDGQVRPEDSPVDIGVFWDYSPISGRVAYASKFFHGAEEPIEGGGTASVSDLWVYDYDDGTAERWLNDLVTKADWVIFETGGVTIERLTAAVFNLEKGYLEIVFVDGPGEMEVIAECGSLQYAWLPGSDQLAYVNQARWSGVSESCLGTFVYRDLDGTTEKISTFGNQELLSGFVGDRPLWAVEQNALIFPDQPFWIVPLDGSEPFVPEFESGENPMEAPRLYDLRWSPSTRQVIGKVDSMMAADGGVYVYEFSEDLRTITEYYQVDSGAARAGDYRLMGWWPGSQDSVLILTAPDEFSPWGTPALWSLSNRALEPLE